MPATPFRDGMQTLIELAGIVVQADEGTGLDTRAALIPALLLYTFASRPQCVTEGDIEPA